MIDTSDPRFAGGAALLVTIEPGLLADSPARVASVELCDPERSSASRLRDPNSPRVVALFTKEWQLASIDTGDLDPLMGQHFLLEALRNLSMSLLTTCKLLGVNAREYLIALQGSMATVTRN